jgi:NADPH-dependent ferric siderophore reductase
VSTTDCVTQAPAEFVLNHGIRFAPDPLAGAPYLTLEVLEVTQLDPFRLRISLVADSLGNIDHLPGQDLMLRVADSGTRAVHRRYTIRDFDPGTRLLDLEVVLGPDGPGAQWAASVVPGETVSAIGPQGALSAVEAADWHLFVGDESGLAFVAAMTEALPYPTTAVVVFGSSGPGVRQPVSAAPGAAPDVRWLHQDDSTLAIAGRLHEAIELPAGNGHAYVTGEAGFVRMARRVLMHRGLSPDAISHQAYWTKGRKNADHGEPAHDFDASSMSPVTQGSVR